MSRYKMQHETSYETNENSVSKLLQIPVTEKKKNIIEKYVCTIPQSKKKTFNYHSSERNWIQNSSSRMIQYKTMLAVFIMVIRSSDI
jgi:hypothetical protein